MKNQLKVSSNMIENHSRLQVMCNIHDKLPSNMEILQDQLNSKLKVDEELNYYKVKWTIFFHKITFLYIPCLIFFS